MQDMKLQDKIVLGLHYITVKCVVVCRFSASFLLCLCMSCNFMSCIFSTLGCG